MQYVAYYIDDRGHNVPIASGMDKAATLGMAAQRVLSLGIVDGSIGVQEQSNLNAAEFSELTKILDDWFVAKIGEH
jgi:hypothetical protein